jgi:Fe-S cluster assembly protein SufB
MGLPESEKRALMGMATDTVIDSRSVHTSYTAELEKNGIIFLPFSDAVKQHPDLIKKHLGTVVPATDNFFAALNAAVFSDGTFVYIPPNTKCPIDLASYFRIETAKIGQFERTLIIADTGAELTYMEGCSAPRRPNHQLHSGVVEIIAHDNATVKYATVQNWFAGDFDGTKNNGGILNFVTKRGICHNNAKLLWTQMEIGSALTWKYPSTILRGNNAYSDFYSLSLTRGAQMADTGTKMIHLGKNTRSTIVSKGISAGKSQNSYRGLVKMLPGADNARNFSQCDSLLIGDKCGAHTFPYIENANKTAVVEHEATTSKISEDQLFYCNQRGIGPEEAVGLIVNGYAREVLSKLPMEFAVEAQKLLQVSLEGSVG